MLTIAFGVIVFTSVMLALVAILLGARSALVASGDVTIAINGGGEHDITTQAGTALLGTLAAAGVFIPSACGGQGTCGVCRVKVTSSGGALVRNSSLRSSSLRSSSNSGASRSRRSERRIVANSAMM